MQWIHYLSRYTNLKSFLFREFTIVLANLLWIYLEFCDSLWIFAKSLWNHYFSREFTINSVSFPRMHYLSRLFTINSLFFLRTQNKFTIFSRIHYLFRDSTMILLSVPRIRYLIREDTMNSLSFWRIYYEFSWSFAIYYGFLRNHYYFTIFLANLL